MRLGGVLAAILLTAAPLGAAARAPKPPANDDCLACHEDPSAKRANGSSLFVDKAAFAASVHGAAGAACIDCHQDLAKTSDFPHPEKLAPVDCAACHESQVADYKKSVHAADRGKSKASKAATCTDCHGIHDIRPSKDPASRTNHLQPPHDVPEVPRERRGRRERRRTAREPAGALPRQHPRQGSGEERAEVRAELRDLPRGARDPRSEEGSREPRVPDARPRDVRDLPREDRRGVRRLDSRDPARQGQPEGARVLRLPHGACRHGLGGRAAPRDSPPVRGLPRILARDVPRHVSRAGERDGLLAHRDLRRLPHRAPDPSGRRRALLGGPRRIA